LKVAARSKSVGSRAANERGSRRSNWIVGSAGVGLPSTVVVVREAVRLSVVAPRLSARVPALVKQRMAGSVRGARGIAISTRSPGAE